mgnify:CR=1 FL=1
MNTYAFIITSLIIILIPGTGVIYTISTGLIKGKKASIIAALGCTAGILPHLFVSIALSSWLMKMSERAFFLLKCAGALYLLYLGISMIVSKTKLEFSKTIDEDKAATIIRKGVFINLLNPKLTLFFFAYLPQYINSNGGRYIIESFILGIGFMILTFIVFVIYGIMAGLMKAMFIKSPKGLKYIQGLFGIIFIAFAANLAMSSI